MPVGGGHHGGGGGGGGGYHGGGHHHHHHGHHGHHGYHGHGGYYHGYHHHRYVGPLYYSPFRWFYRSMILFILVCTISIIVFSIGVSGFFAGPSPVSVDASPQDYRLLAYSQSSCGHLELSTSQNLYPVNLYLLTSSPPRVRGDSFTVSDSWYLGKRDYKFYFYYLVAGSSVSGSFYVQNSFSPKTLYILDKNQFYNFDHDRSYTWLYSQACKSAQQSSPCYFSYSVYSDAEYYFVFDGGSNSGYVYPTLNVQKYIYSFAESDTFDSCQASCILRIPSSPKLYPLVTTANISESGNWEDKVSYKWFCSDSKFSVPTWVYLMTIFGVLFLVVSIVGAILTAVLLLYRKKSASTVDTAPLITDADQSPTVTRPFVTPPLVNPNAPPMYSNPSALNPNPPPYPQHGPPPGYKS